MTKQLLLGVSTLAFVVGLGLSAAYANPTAKDNDHNYFSAIGNVTNLVGVGIYQGASADGSAGASADDNSYWSDASAGATGIGGHAGYNGAVVGIAVETGNVAILSENDMSAYVGNEGSVTAYSYYGSAGAGTGDASQNNYQQKYAAGMFNNALNTGLGNAQQQGNAASVNAGTITF